MAEKELTEVITFDSIERLRLKDHSSPGDGLNSPILKWKIFSGGRAYLFKQYMMDGEFPYELLMFKVPEQVRSQRVEFPEPLIYDKKNVCFSITLKALIPPRCLPLQCSPSVKPL